MSSFSKSLLILLIVILSFSSLTIVKPAFAGSIPKPSVPKLTANFENGTSYHAAIYSFDQYTGKNVTVSQAYYQEWAQINVIIQNQPFTPYQDSNGTWIQLYYNIQEKGHYSDSWGTVASPGADPDDEGYTPQNSKSNVSGIEVNAENFAPNSTMDFRVQAMIGYLKELNVSPLLHMPKVFVGETSDWSDTQTVTIPYNINSDDISGINSGPSPSPSSATSNLSNSPSSIPTTSSQPQNNQNETRLRLDWWEIGVFVLLMAIAVLLVFAVFYLRKRTLLLAQQKSVG